MKPEEYIKRYGGKAGGYFFLRDFGGFERNLPETHAYLHRNEDFSAIADKVPVESNFPMIARGSHPNDHEGLVDVLRTMSHIWTRDGLKDCIEIIRKDANHPLIFGYNEYEGQAYDGKVGILVQRQTPDGLKGSVVEHPHERGTLLIDYVDFNIHKDKLLNRVVVRGDDIDNSLEICSPNTEISRMVVDLYRRVRETGFIPDDMSFQMEFGINDIHYPKREDVVLFYQARPFKRFEEPTFELWDRTEYGCYGITPEEGIVLPVVKINYGNDDQANEVGEPFAMIVECLTGPLRVACQPRSMKAFLPIGLRVDYLEHNNYRWIRKADVSILSPYHEHWLNGLNDGDNIRIRSNGLHFKVEKEESKAS